MRKFTNRQYVLLITEILVFIVLASQLVSLSIDNSLVGNRNKYRKSIDSVETLNSKISSFQNFDISFKRDYFNFKKKKVAKKVIAQKKIIKKRNYTWVKTIKLYGKDKLKFALFFNGKARFDVDGKKRMVGVGDKLVVGHIIAKQKDVDSGIFTGKTENRGVYKGQVLSVQRRAVYINTFYSKKVVLYKPGANGKLFNRGLIPKTGVKSSNSNSGSADDNDEFNLRERLP